MSIFKLFIYMGIAWVIAFLVIGYAHGEPILHGLAHGNGSIYNVDINICFANETLMRKYLDLNPDIHFNVTVPCPELAKEYTQREDESGK